MAARTRDLKKESFWRRVVRQQAGSGLTARAWCRKRRMKEASFYGWRRELALRDAEREQASFVPVRVTADDDEGRIEIVLSGGRRVRIHGHVDRQMLSDVLAVLEAEAC